MARLMTLALLFCFLPFAAAESGVSARHHRYPHHYQPSRPKASFPPRGEQPLSEEMERRIAQLGTEVRSRILIRIFKREDARNGGMLEVWKQTLEGTFALLAKYPVCKMAGGLGPKMREGDRQSPEGFYPVLARQLHPHSQEYVAFSIGFPNTYDKANGRTGSFVMVHGGCASTGCFAMTHKYIAEIYALVREAFAGGQESFQVHIFPFRMTEKNMKAHGDSPHIAFWRMLKEGYDRFEATKEELPIEVCEKRYVLDASVSDDPDQKLLPCVPLEPSDK